MVKNVSLRPEGITQSGTVDGITYYLPFEYEITSQRFDSLSLGNGLMNGSVWFTYPESRFYPVDSLYKFIKQNYERKGSNILLSTAPDKTGTYRMADRESIVRRGYFSFIVVNLMSVIRW